MDIFGPGWKDYEKRIEENWRRDIAEDDLIIIPGDISWGLRREEAEADLAWIRALPGQKVLIKGNHDLWWQGITALNKYDPKMRFLQFDCACYEDVAICGSRGWICPGADAFKKEDEKIYRRELLRVEASLKAGKASGAKYLIGALHYPPTNEKKQPSEFTKLFEDYGVQQVVYGHLHGTDGFRNALEGNLNGVRYRLVSQDRLMGQPLQIL